MSATFTRRARYFTFAGLATLGLAALSQLAVTTTAQSVDVPYTETLHQDPPIKNSEFEDDENDCPGSPAQWGWHFILTGGEATFVELTTTFETAGVIVTTTFGPPDAKHAYVYTATDDTLTGATALVTGGDESKTMLVLSHTCDGGGTSTPSPTPSVTPSETPSSTPSETPSSTPSETPSSTPSETPSSTPSETPSETPSATVSATETATPSETPSESESPTPSAEVSGTQFTQSPSETPDETVVPSATVSGVKETRGPAVIGTDLPSTGNAAPVGLLLALGFGLIAVGVVSTVAGEPHAAPAGGKHRR